MGAREARKLVEEYGVKGFKFHPTVQGFEPSRHDGLADLRGDRRAQAAAVFHSGHSGIGCGMRCGGGLRLQNSNPMLLEDVAIAFPDMQIIVAHPSWPWQDEAISLAMHKPNIWIDLSGWSPKYFPPQLVQYANTLLKDRILFGSDFPLITPDRWLKDFEEAGFKDDVKPLILKQNAMRLLGLADARAPRRGAAASRGPPRGERQGLTVSLFSTDFTPSVPLAIATALSALPALSASRSGSRRRPWCRRRSPGPSRRGRRGAWS
jgi:predicted TIM-barrel fold metal-dependent hydrolase